LRYNSRNGFNKEEFDKANNPQTEDILPDINCCEISCQNARIKMGIENVFKLDEFTEIFLCIRSKRMNGEKPSKIKTIKLNRLLETPKKYLFYLI
jgi:hypothetical protein